MPGEEPHLSQTVLIQLLSRAKQHGQGLVIIGGSEQPLEDVKSPQTKAARPSHLKLVDAVTKKP